MEDWNNDGKIDAEDEIYPELIIFDDTDFFLMTTAAGQNAPHVRRTRPPLKAPKRGRRFRRKIPDAAVFLAFRR